MSVLATRTHDPARPWRASSASPDPTIPIETRIGTFDRPHAPFDHPADASRARHLLGVEFQYIAHPSFDDPDGRDAILAPMPAPAVSRAPRRTKAPEGLLPYLTSLYDEGPLLTGEQEVHLFRKMNYLVYRAAHLRDRINPRRVRTGDLDEIERHLKDARAIKDQIIRANLRLVVSIAKRHVGPNGDLFELVSDGNFALIQAVERFDFARGNKFSTYATWVIHNQIAQTKRKKNHGRPQFLFGCDATLANATDPHTEELEQLDAQERREATVAGWLGRLDDRARRILVGRHGIGGGRKRTLKQIGNELGISKERVRQIEAQALARLRELGRTKEFDLLPA